ncbi:MULTISPECIES: alkaline shock response membrane anchor protein AmaP [unclassified Amycolatopsis]|uniref:alkaline shock response membrane anchor protein AmaP n=1 Tax=unclassified Amycolatopsis TaxID=2618356 RepID=UPI00106EAFB2|nr:MULTISPECIES: alkaline shock response membrane anchor protein AmaP [unclassified Amycolatopsis]
MNRPATLNRVLLAVIGLVLLAAGGFGLATHFRVLRFIDPEAPLVPGTAEPPTWVFYAIAAAAVVAGLLALRWMLAQLAHRPRTGVWRFETDPAYGRTELRADDAVAPFVEELRGHPGVHKASASLAGTRETPSLALILTCERDADLGEIRGRVTGESLPRLEEALELKDIPVAIEFRFTGKAASRVG